MDRRSFFKSTCIMTLLGTGFSVPAVMNAESKKEDKSKEHCKWWFSQLFEQVSSCEVNDDCRSLVEGVGRECATKHLAKSIASHKGKASALRSDPEALAKLINKDLFRTNLLKVKDGNLVASWDKCLCPTRAGGYIDSPEFCYCTRGFFKEMFKGLLGSETEVTLEKAIGRGDKICKVIIKL